MIAQKQQSNLAQESIPIERTVRGLLNVFVDAICSEETIESKICMLSKIKQSIINNPNNYYHPYYQRVSFVDIYEFVIECLSHQHHPSLMGYLLHVLALMVKSWIIDPSNIKKLYDGILQLFEQRSFCGQNCFKFLTVLVQTMQEGDNCLGSQNDGGKDIGNYSQIPILRASLENYFVYHLLNQLLAFANIFLERSVVRNQQLSQNINTGNNRKSQDDCRVRVSQSFNSSSNSKMDGSNLRENSLTSDISQQYQLYKLQQSEPVILSILSLIRACLSYDFSHTSRHQPESQYEVSKSPIILPTKYSKYCRFSQYDILLKNQTTTELLNYLFLVCNSIELKLEILKIIQSMSRIHFRYFKNKEIHRVHLEDIGYVIGNLLTGLDLNQPMSVNIAGQVKTWMIDRNTKVSIALGLGQIVSLLLYHQPTFYLVEISLMEMIMEHIEAFVLNELLDSDNFIGVEEGEGWSSGERGRGFPVKLRNSGKVSKSDMCLLIETFISPLYKLKDNIRNYLSKNDSFTEKISQLYLKIGQKYYQMLTIHLQQNDDWMNCMPMIKKQEEGIEEGEIVCSSSAKQGEREKICEQMGMRAVSKNDGSSKNVNFTYQIQSDEQEETDNNEQPFMTIKINTIDEINESSKQNQDKQETQTNINICQHDVNQGKGADKSNDTSQHKYQSFLESIIEEQGNIGSISNLLWIFRVYCPKHKYIASYHEKMGKEKNTFNGESSDIETKTLYRNTCQIITTNKSMVDSNNIANSHTDNNNSLNPQSTHQNPKILLPKLTQNSQLTKPNNITQIKTYHCWLISWLCNFQHLFHITAGHCRMSKDWQVEIKLEFMVQLIEDFNYVIDGYNTRVKLGKNQGNYDREYQRNRYKVLGKDQLAQIGKCVQISLSFMMDKITNQCRIPSQQYMHHIHIDIISIIEFIVYYYVVSFQSESENSKNRYIKINKNHQLPISPIIDVLTNINTYTYINKGYLETLPIQYDKPEKQIKIKKMAEIRCRCISIISSIGRMLYVQSVVKECDKECINLLSSIIFIVMKMYISNKQINDSYICNNPIDNTNDNKYHYYNNNDTQLHQSFQHIFSNQYPLSQQNFNNSYQIDLLPLWPLYLMHGIIDELHKNIINSQHHHSNRRYTYNDMMSIYSIQQVYTHQLLTYYIHHIEQQQHRDNKQDDRRRTEQWSELYLALLELCVPMVYLEKKRWCYGGYLLVNQQQMKKYSLVQVYKFADKLIYFCWQKLILLDRNCYDDDKCKDGCQCFQFVSAIIKLYLELQSIGNEIKNLQSNSIKQQELLQYIIKHRQCMVKQSYSKIIPFVQSVIKVIHINSNDHDDNQDGINKIIDQISHHFCNQNNQYHEHRVNTTDFYVIKIVRYFNFLLQLLSELHTKYSYNNSYNRNNCRQLYKLQQCVLHSIITYHYKNNNINNSATISGIIKILQNIYSNITGLPQLPIPTILNPNSNTSELQYFISSTAKSNAQYLLSQLLLYLQSNMTQTLHIPISPQPTNRTVQQFQKHTTLKIDNIISLFARNHTLLEILYQRYKAVLESTISNDIILECVRYNWEKGVAWVVHRLELWNNEELGNLDEKNSERGKNIEIHHREIISSIQQFGQQEKDRHSQHISSQQTIPLYNSPKNINLITSTKTDLSPEYSSKNKKQKNISQVKSQIANNYIDRYIDRIISSSNDYQNRGILEEMEHGELNNGVNDNEKM